MTSVAAMRWMVAGGKPVMEESSPLPAFPGSATASMVSMAFKATSFIFGVQRLPASRGAKGDQGSEFTVQGFQFTVGQTKVSPI